MGTGAKMNQIAWPYGIALDQDGQLYISDHINDRVMKWRWDKNEGVIVAGGRGRGIDPDQLHGPAGIMFDPYNKLIVADSANHRIMQWQMDGKGKFVRDGECIAGGNLAGYALNQLCWPFNVSMNKHGDLLIADFSNHRVMKWYPNSPSGVVFAGGEGLGT